MHRRLFVLSLSILACVAFTHCGTAYLEPASSGPDYFVQGEYAAVGASHAAQVIALGGGEFELALFEGGLPGDGWNGAAPQRLAGRRTSDSRVEFEGAALEARHAQGSLHLRGATRAANAPELELERIVRQSPTLGASPPPGARILFASRPGTCDVVNATDGSVDERGWLEAGATSTEAFGSMHLHVEFRTPFMPDSRGQARGNSGIYIQDRYEVQVLDSFGLDPASNDCAAVYEVAAPRINMSFPPLQWQTYDIDFEQAVFDAEGRKTASARVSVRHNGVLVHDRLAIPAPTGFGNAEAPTPGRLVFQNHLNPVVYRNIWVVPLADGPVGAARENRAAISWSAAR